MEDHIRLHNDIIGLIDQKDLLLELVAYAKAKIVVELTAEFLVLALDVLLAGDVGVFDGLVYF